MQPKVNRNKVMLIGAVAAVAALLVKRALGLDPNPNDTYAYWFSVLLGGAQIGLGVAALINRKPD